MTKPDRVSYGLPLVSGILTLFVLIYVAVLLGDFAYLVPAILIVVPLSLILIWKFPGVIFAAYLYIPFYKNAIDAYTPVDITPVLALACIAAAIISCRSWLNIQTASLLAPWTALLAVIALGVAYSFDAASSFATLIEFFALVYLPLLLGIRVAMDDRLLRQFLVATAVVSIGIVLSGIVSLIGSTIGVGGRLQLSASNTIGISRAAMLFPVFVLAGWVGMKANHRLLSVGIIPLCFLVAFSAGSRGPLLMAAITVVCLQLWNMRNIIKVMAAGLAAVVVVVAAVQIESIRQLIPSGALMRFTALVDAVLGRGELDRSSSARLEMYEAAFNMFDAHPWLGMGTSSFHQYAASNTSVPDPHYPHNLLLQFGAEFGIIGLIILTWLLIRVGANTVVQKFGGRQLAIIGLALFAFLNSMVSSGIYDNRWMWGMLIMAGAVTGQPLRQVYAQRRLAKTRAKRLRTFRGVRAPEAVISGSA